jgi:hypothetical protein
VVSVIRGLMPPERKLENWRNERFVSFKMHAKQEQAVTWWNPAAQMRPVLDSSSFVPVPTLKCQNPLLAYVRGREKLHCNVQYTLLLLCLMLVMSYWA